MKNKKHKRNKKEKKQAGKSRKLPIVLFIAFLFLAIIIYFVFSRYSAVAPYYTYEIVNTYPHDPNAFTQGLLYEDGYLYESTGLEGHSSIRKVELETGKVIQDYNLPNEFFGEGLTIFGDKIIQLTWRNHSGFVYDKESFKLKDGFTYSTEGWGITHNGKNLIMSDGTPTLYFLNPKTFKIVSKQNVYYKGALQYNLNELEYINGKIYANIWKTDSIAIINPKNGQIEGIIDLTGLLKRTGSINVLNGIAYDAKEKRVFVTGKLWPKLFEIKLVPKKQS